MSSIVRRSVTSVSWNVVAQAITVVVGFGRSVLLARLLEVDTFGVYAGATAIVGLAWVVASMGLGIAFVHRAQETEDEDRAAAVFLSMMLIAAAVWLTVMLTAISLFSSGETRTAMMVIAVTTAIEQLSQVPASVHVRRVQHRRLALLSVINVLAISVVTVTLAWLGVELWALLAGECMTVVVMFVGLFLWRPIWRAHLAWDLNVVRYFLRFGFPAMVATLLDTALQRIDDIFVRYRLGVTQMGYYSRAYTFASYPRGILSSSVASVAGGAFAELAHDRLKLSMAYFRVNAFLVRAGFLFAGWLVLVAPEFVTILLGDKWLPMVPIFRLLAVFALLDPLRDVLGVLFLAVGQPKRLVNYRLIQLGVLVAGLAVLGTLYGTVGVALAVDIMLTAGIAMMVAGARPWVDFSPLRLFVWPGVALALGMGAAFGVSVLMELTLETPWMTGFVKTLVWIAVFGSVMVAAERRELLDSLNMVRRSVGSSRL